MPDSDATLTRLFGHLWLKKLSWSSKRGSAASEFSSPSGSERHPDLSATTTNAYVSGHPGDSEASSSGGASTPLRCHAADHAAGAASPGALMPRLSALRALRALRWRAGSTGSSPSSASMLGECERLERDLGRGSGSDVPSCGTVDQSPRFGDGTPKLPDTPPLLRPHADVPALEAGASPGAALRAEGDPLAAQQHPPGSAAPAAAASKTIAVAAHCPAHLRTDVWSLDDFQLLKCLHRGNAAYVWRARHLPSGQQVALKLYKRRKLSDMGRFQLAREICLHVRAVHPHIVPMWAAWKDARYVCLLLEWEPAGSLLDAMQRAPRGRLGEAVVARQVAAPLLSALAWLHRQGLIHRDVKPENCLLDGAGTLMVADFGLAIDATAELVNTRLGTFGYLAPEVLDCPLKAAPFEHKGGTLPPGAAEGGADAPPASMPTAYTEKCDVWSAGVVVYEALTGRTPFDAPTLAGILDAIASRPVALPAHVSPQAAAFVRRMLERDVPRRASAAELLQDPWLAAHGAAAAAGAVA